MTRRPRTPHPLAALLVLSFAGALAIGGSSVLAQPPNSYSSGEVALALRRLLVVGNVLYVGAHPDDENTAMLPWLSRGRLYRAAYLSLTRGDGGQNLIGPERGEQIGLIRTQELLAARRIDGAEQFFTRAIDFGYSKSPEETLSIWGKDEVLSDIVRVIRTFRPDVIITRFPTNGDGGHGHHTASALLAEEAFLAAADPARFPDQIARDGLAPWAARRLMWNAWRVKPEDRDPKLPKLLEVDLGAYNPFLGRSYSEIAAESRSMHRSQGFGTAERRGTLVNYLEPRLGESATSDLMDGIDTTWRRVPGGEAVIAPLEKAVRMFRPDRPADVIPLLVEARRKMATLSPSPWVAEKEREVNEAIRTAGGLWFEAIAARFAATPGSELPVSVIVLSRSDAPIVVRSIELPWATKPFEGATRLENNRPMKTDFSVRIPETTDETNPYWLDVPATLGLFRVAGALSIGRPESPPALMARITLEVAGEVLGFDVPVQHRSTDPVIGERYRPLEITPKVSLHLAAPVLLFPDRNAREVGVTVRAGRKDVSGVASLKVPPGWISSAAQPFSLRNEEDEALLRFTMTPPAGPAAVTVRAEATVDGTTFSHDVVRIDYPYIPPIALSPAAEARLVREDTLVRAKRIGYVMGSGDEVPEALRQLGLDVTLLSDEALATAPLGRYDAIVAGVRAYNTRKRLASVQSRLLEYVKEGGTYVVQYNTSQDLVAPDVGPFPLKLSRDRVTVEGAPVRLLDQGHPLLSVPNRIGPRDFEGWVQERGLYYPGSWDERYEALLAMADPGEKETKGALLVARYGKGTFIYTGVSFFRQLPAGVPGAYRLFANLVSAGKS